MGKNVVLKWSLLPLMLNVHNTILQKEKVKRFTSKHSICHTLKFSNLPNLPLQLQICICNFLLSFCFEHLPLKSVCTLPELVTSHLSCLQVFNNPLLFGDLRGHILHSSTISVKLSSTERKGVSLYLKISIPLLHSLNTERCQSTPYLKKKNPRYFITKEAEWKKP